MIYVTILDINECASNGGRGPCDDTCENKDGGYECGCSFPGSKLSKDNHTCLGKQMYHTVQLQKFTVESYSLLCYNVRC